MNNHYKFKTFINLKSLLYLFVVLVVGISWVMAASFVQVQSKEQSLEKKPLTHDVYDSWKTIQSPQISPDGRWILYSETPQDGDAHLVIIDLSTKKEARFPLGYSGEETEAHRKAQASFTADSAHVVYFISPTQEEAEKLKKEKNKKEQKIKLKLGVINLSTGQLTTVERVKSFKFPKENGQWLAYLKEKEEPETPTEKKDEKQPAKTPEEEKESEKKPEIKYGSLLVLRSLETGKERTFEDVLEYFFTKNGEALIFTVSSKGKPESDGVYVFQTKSQKLLPLLTGKGRYEKLVINEKETKLAFLTDRDSQDSDPPLFSVYGWNFKSPTAKLWVSAERVNELYPGLAPSNKSDLIFSRDGQHLVFGFKEPPTEKKDEEDKKDKEKKEEAEFELWHWNDPYPQPQQKKMADRVKNNTWECVYHLETDKLVKLADENLPDVQLHESGQIAWGETVIPYTKLISYDGTYYDVYLVDTQTGKRTLVKKKLFRGANLSPQGKFVYWFEDGNWFIYNIQTKKTKNVTAGLGVNFFQEDWDQPNPPASYGFAGWTTNDEAFLVYDRFDIWVIKPDGSDAHRLTEGFGRENHLSFRYLRLDPEEKNIDPKKPLLLRVRDEDTMAEGFYTDRVQGREKPQKLLVAPKRFASVSKAKKADRVIFSRMSFDEYPDLWVADLKFKNPRRVTNLGSQMESYIWGKAELRDFYSADGKLLKGILIKPENFDPNHKYPLLVYIYETLHYMLHIFRHPSPGTSINPSYYVSNGYLIWMPDIEYETGYPGRDALKCVPPGINMLISEGYVNPKAIGIQGHSWGGYQVAYLVTQTDIFAAAEAGAPVVNMTSAYNGIRWGSGMVRQFQYERTQSRLGDSLWRVPLRYIENSPVFWADKIKTPLLIIHNDQDGAVPWYQGIEFIMSLRRLEKVAFMFNYNGEEHGLQKRVNQKDWTKRMAEFFDHYLKSKPAPKWMKEGIKAWEKD